MRLLQNAGARFRTRRDHGELPEAPHSLSAREATSAKRLARFAGLLYLILVVFAGFSLYVRSSVMAAGDPGATADNIRASATLVRLGFGADLVHIAAFVLTALVLYALLSRVSQKIALAFVILSAIAVAIMGVNMLNLLGALVLATNPVYGAGLGATAADTLSQVFLDLHFHGHEVQFVFSGLWLVPLGYLVYKSGYFPRLFGVMLIVGCVGYLARLVAVYSSRGFESVLDPYLLVPGALAEISFMVWLLVKGADVQRQTNPLPRSTA